jgi:hypothetical protein
MSTVRTVFPDARCFLVKDLNKGRMRLLNTEVRVAPQRRGFPPLSSFPDHIKECLLSIYYACEYILNQNTWTGMRNQEVSICGALLMSVHNLASIFF